MKKTSLLFSAFLVLLSLSLSAQVAVSTDGSNAHPSAMLEVKSTEKGFLLPRMTQAERNLITSPAAGLVVWCTNCGTNGEMQLFNGTAWTNMTGGTAAIPWVCGAGFTDSRDGKTYSTVLIGTQCWMAQNLNVGTRINGNVNQSSNSTIEKYCYADNESNCTTYGGLYQWDEMMQYSTTPGIQGICPEGWHLPTDAEWCTLTQFIDPTVNCNTTGGSGTDVGTKMKSTTGWLSGGNGTNNSGFTALPGGSRGISGDFYMLGNNAFFWSSTEFNTNSAWYRELNYYDPNVRRFNTNKALGIGVRCLQD